MSDANSRKRGQGRGGRRPGSGPNTGPSSRGSRGRSPRREPAKPTDLTSTPEEPGTGRPAEPPVSGRGRRGPAVPGDSGGARAGSPGVPGDSARPDSTGRRNDGPRDGAGSGTRSAASGAAATSRAGSPKGRRGKTAASRVLAGAADGSGGAGPVAGAGASAPASARGSDRPGDVPPAGSPRPKLSASTVQRVRRFLLAALSVDGVALLFIIAAAIIGVTVMGGGFTPLPATIASLWMLFNLGPFEYGGTDLGLVPALPAMALFAGVAWRVRREVSGPIGVRDVRVLAVTFLAVPVALTVTAWLMLWDASGVLRIDAPNFWIALASTICIHGGALVVGLGSRLLRALLRRRRLPEWPLGSLRLAAGYVGWLWAAGAVVTLASMAIHVPAVRETFGIADGGGEVAALGLLSLAYLPNVAFAAAGILVGAPANVGAAEAGLFAVTPGTLPPLPVLAAMPQSHVTAAYGVLLAVPVGLALWRSIVHVRTRASERPYVEVVLAAILVGVLVAALALLLGGEVGQYGWSGLSWWFAGVMASVWFVVPGALAVVFISGPPVREPALADDPVPATPAAPDVDEASGGDDAAADADSDDDGGDDGDSGDDGEDADPDPDGAGDEAASESDADGDGAHDDAPEAADAEGTEGAGAAGSEDEDPAVAEETGATEDSDATADAARPEATEDAGATGDTAGADESDAGTELPDAAVEADSPDEAGGDPDSPETGVGKREGPGEGA